MDGKMKKGLFIALLCGVVFASCDNNNLDNIIENNDAFGKRTFIVSSDNSETRAVFNGTNGSLWKATDKIGVIATYGRYGYVTDETIQPFAISNAGDAETVEIGEFTGALTDKGSKTYVYYAYTPYSENVSSENLEEVPCTLPATQYPTAISWDSDADYMVAYPIEQTSDNVGGNDDIGFRFTRVFGMLRLSFDESWTSLYGDKAVKRVTITAGGSDKLAGDFTLDIMNEPSESSKQIVRYTMGNNAVNAITLDYADKNILFKDLQAYFMLNPGSYESVEIVVALDGVVITANRTNLTVTRGSLLSAPVSKKAEDKIQDASYIEITTPGSLGSKLNDLGINLESIIKLKLSGEINAQDFTTIRSMSNLVSLDLGETIVNTIHSYALKGMSKLKTLVLPNTTSKIEDDAFDECRNIESITWGDAISYVEYCAFEPLDNLKDVYISDMASWCNICFERDFYTNPLYHTDNLYLNNELVTELVIPEGVTQIGSYAFSGCEFLTSVVIPDSVTSVGDSAFEGCLNLPIDNGLRYADTYLITPVVESLSTYIIKEGTRFIGNGAFSGCTNLANITIPDSVISIGSGAFSGCTNLTSISIGTGVASIGRSAFYNCTNLANITIPDSVVSIGGNAFYGCTNLTSISIGAGVASIGRSAFYRCANLNEVHIADIASWCKISHNEDSGSDAVSSNPLYLAKNLYYNGNLVTNLVIPEGVTFIGDYCFYKYDKLESITLPSSIQIVGWQAFDKCHNLTKIFCRAITPPELYYYSESYDIDYYYYSIPKNDGMKIYVPRNAYNSYMQYTYAWDRYYDPTPYNWYLYESYIEPYDF